jgi:hypothetical protein
MENPNEQTQSYIINLLVRYGSLNSIYNEVFETKKLTVSQQRIIYNFHKDFKNTELFETELLSFFLSDNQTKNLNIVNLLKLKIQSSISLYDENLLFVSKINVYEVCYYYVEDLYKNRIKLISDRVWEYGKKRRDLNREIEPPFWEPLSKEKEARIRIDLKRYEALEIEAKEELNVIYCESNKDRDEIFKYKKNVFNDLRELGLRFISIINSCFVELKEIVDEESQINPKSIGCFNKKESNKVFKNNEIKESDIFRPNMFVKLLGLEKRLLKEGLLDDNLKWNPAPSPGITALRLVIVFIVRLDTNGYFMSKASDKQKREFFESRYSVEIGQNFEENRRDRYLKKYHGVYSDYLF